MTTFPLHSFCLTQQVVDELLDKRFDPTKRNAPSSNLLFSGSILKDIEDAKKSKLASKVTGEQPVFSRGNHWSPYVGAISQRDQNRYPFRQGNDNPDGINTRGKATLDPPITHQQTVLKDALYPVQPKQSQFVMSLFSAPKKIYR